MKKMKTFKEFDQYYKILIPKKLRRLLLEGHIDCSVLNYSKLIDCIERVIIALSLIATGSQGQKHLYVEIHSSTLEKILGDNYAILIKLLTVGTIPEGKGKRIPILEVRKGYKVGKKCKRYRFHKHYWGIGLELYTLTSYKVNKVFKKMYVSFYELQHQAENPVSQWLIGSYPFVEYPSIFKIREYGEYLCSIGYNHKGKYLTYIEETEENIKNLLLDHNLISENALFKTILKTYKKYFVHLDSHMVRIENALSNPYRLPRRSKNCPRVNDSFVHLPSWVRDLIKISGEYSVEVDLQCAHWWLFVSRYRNQLCEEDIIKLKYVGSDIITFLVNRWNENKGYPKITRDQMKIKVQRLFNSHSKHFNKERIYKLVKEEFPSLVGQIDALKFQGVLIHNIIFQDEVDLMSEVCSELHRHSVKGLYFYDGVYVPMSFGKWLRNNLNSHLELKKIWTVAVPKTSSANPSKLKGICDAFN